MSGHSVHAGVAAATTIGTSETITRSAIYTPVARIRWTAAARVVADSASMGVSMMASDIATAIRSGCHAGRAVVRSAEVTTIPAIMHAEVLSVGCTEVLPVAVVVTMSPMNVPGMSSTIGGIEVRTSEEEIVTMRIAAIDAEVPVACLPVEWAIEVAGCQVGVPLPVEQDIAEIEISALPIGAEHVSATSYTHQVVEVDFVSCFVLLISQIQLVCHLVGEEQGLATGLLVAHCTCCHRCGQHHHQCEKHLLHNRIILIVQHSLFLIHSAK